MLRLNELYEEDAQQEKREEVSTDFFDFEGLIGWVRDAFALKGALKDAEEQSEDRQER